MLNTKLLRSWLLFALGVLLLANLMALLLVFLKLPLLPAEWQSQRWFARALVLHVDLSILVWALSMVSLMWLIHLPRGSLRLDRIAMGLLLGSGLGMLTSIALHQGQPLLSNYIPVLDAPLYLTSLGAFVLGVILVALPRVSGFRLRSDVPLPQSAFMLALLALLVTVVVQFSAWLKLPSSMLDQPQAELLFWGAGHSLQAVYLCALLGGWFQLLKRAGMSQTPLLISINHRVGLLLMLPVIAAPLFISLLWAPDNPDYRDAFSIWMRLFSLPMLGVMVVLAWSLLRMRLQGLRSATDWRLLAVGLSMLLFLLGVVVGALIRGDSLLVPAHYHATTGAVNLIFMALIYDLLCAANDERGSPLQLKTYATGVILMVTGLGLSGFMGVGRKLAGADQQLESMAETAAMLLMGAGGSVALVASFWFLFKALRALLRVPCRSSQTPMREVRGS